MSNIQDKERLFNGEQPISSAYPIPSFDHKEHLGETIKSSAKRRGMSPIRFATRKIKNIILYRLSFFCPINSWRIWMHRQRGCHIGKHCYIGQQVVLDNAYPELVYIEDYASVNQGSFILTHTNARSFFDGIIICQAAPVIIRRGAMISINSTILPGREIGKYAIVNAGSVVMKNVADYSMIMGNPAEEVANFQAFIDANLNLEKK